MLIGESDLNPLVNATLLANTLCLRLAAADSQQHITNDRSKTVKYHSEVHINLRILTKKNNVCR